MQNLNFYRILLMSQVLMLQMKALNLCHLISFSDKISFYDIPSFSVNFCKIYFETIMELKPLTKYVPCSNVNPLLPTYIYIGRSS